jgi:uncharacterized protein DUF3558
MSKLTLATVFCLAVSIGGAAVACDGSEKGNPTQASGSSTGTPTSSGSSSSTGTAATLPFSGAPKVANPLDVQKFEDDPCLALTPQQVQQVEVGPGKKTEEALGPECIWRKPEDVASINLYFLRDSKEGLSAFYRASDDGKYDKFEPVEDVSGFPAVVVGNEGDDARGVCYMYIGLSDELAVQLAVQQSSQKRGTVDPCEVTKAVSQLIVENMKAGA